MPYNDSMKKVIPVFLILITLFSCSSHKTKQKVAVDFDFSDCVQLTDAMSSYNDRLLTEIDDGKSNIVFSPLGTYNLLFALMKGGAGQTEEELADVLNLTGLADQEQCMKKILLSTENMTDSLWLQKGVALNAPYKSELEDMGFSVQQVDFIKNPEKTRRTINSFISEKTDRVFKNAVSTDFPQNTRLVLLNTLCFDQAWRYPFKSDETRNGTFYLSDGNEITVPLMKGIKEVDYAAFDGFSAVELIYADTRYSFVALLPDDKTGQLGDVSVSSLLKQFDEKKESMIVHIKLPKFAFTAAYELTPVFQKMGIQAAFSWNEADFSRMVSDMEPLYADSCIHQVAFSVDEERTKAHSFFMLDAKAASAPLYDAEFYADHPFCFVIRDSLTGTLLYTGILRNPL